MSRVFPSPLRTAAVLAAALCGSAGSAAAQASPEGVPWEMRTTERARRERAAAGEFGGATGGLIGLPLGAAAGVLLASVTDEGDGLSMMLCGAAIGAAAGKNLGEQLGWAAVGLVHDRGRTVGGLWDEAERSVRQTGRDLRRETRRVAGQVEREADRTADRVEREAKRVGRQVEAEAERVWRKLTRRD